MPNKIIHFSRLAAEIKHDEREVVIYLKDPQKKIYCEQAKKLMDWATRTITTNYPGYNIHVKAVEKWRITGLKTAKKKRQKRAAARLRAKPEKDSTSDLKCKVHHYRKKKRNSN